MIKNTCRQEIHYSACGLHTCHVFRSRFDGLVFVCSSDLTPIALSDKVLVHLVLPRCEVVSIQLLSRESTPHLSIHYVKSSSSSSLFECELCSKATIAKSRFLVVGVGHNARGWARSSYQIALIPCKESWWMILCSRLDMECACVYVRVRETRSGDTQNTQANVY